MAHSSVKTHNDKADFSTIPGTDHIELYVANAKQAAQFYKDNLGFQFEAYEGPETGIQDHCSYVLRLQNIRLVLTAALHADHPIAQHVKKYGDGVKMLALRSGGIYKSFGKAGDHRKVSAKRAAISTGKEIDKFVVNELTKNIEKSHFDQYFNDYKSAALQHTALATDDIVSTVRALKARGIKFSPAPPEAYYTMLAERVGEIEEEIETIQELGIMVNRDEDGYLLQIFAKPVQGHPTLFFEIIQRKVAQNFGANNYK